MISAAILASLIAAGDAGAQEEQPAARPITDDVILAPSVNRAIEEPGRYGPSNLFDGDAETVFCSAPRSGRASVSVYLSDADQARLRKAKRLRVTPSPTFSNLKVNVLVGSGSIGPGVGRSAATIGTAVEETAFVLPADGSDIGSSIVISLERGDPRHDRSPLCLADLAFLGPAGPIELPDLTRAVKAAKQRDAELARLTTDRAAFARAYMTSFTWTVRNPNKEHDDWESTGYRFLPDGTYEQTTYHGWGERMNQPERMTGRWSISKDGKSVLFGGRPAKLVRCGVSGGTLCVGSSLFFPNVSR